MRCLKSSVISIPCLREPPLTALPQTGVIEGSNPAGSYTSLQVKLESI